MASRRKFIASSILAIGATSLSVPGRSSSFKTAKKIPFELGLASYSLRKFDLSKALEISNRVGLKHICLKSMHLPLDSSTEELKAADQQVAQAGIDLYGCGVVYMKSKDQVDQAFEYARHAGMKAIIGVPEHDLLPYVNKKVKVYDLQLAIHNHGPGDEKYPSAESIYTRIQGLDPRIGICLDIGHTTRIGEDPSADVRRFRDRILDVHIKDVNAAKPEGETVEIGRGIIDIPGFVVTLMRIGFDGVVSFEYEKDADDPLAGLAESVGYVHGVVDALPTM